MVRKRRGIRHIITKNIIYTPDVGTSPAVPGKQGLVSDLLFRLENLAMCQADVGVVFVFLIILLMVEVRVKYILTMFDLMLILSF